jgi:hypothetical protein
MSPCLGTTAPRPVPPDGPTACVWELQAIHHEFEAWIHHVLTRPAAPDFAGYLAATLTVEGQLPNRTSGERDANQPQARDQTEPPSSTQPTH